MKALSSIIYSVTGSGTSSRRNISQLMKLIIIVMVFVLVSSSVFHLLMKTEGRSENYHWFDGFYWTMVTMSTLGYGEITFNEWPGKLFSIGVMLNQGCSFLLSASLIFVCLLNQEAYEVRPVTKVVNLVKDMLKQLEKEAEENEEIYDQLACWCEINDKGKTKSIADAETRIDEFKEKKTVLEKEELGAQQALAQIIQLSDNVGSRTG